MRQELSYAVFKTAAGWMGVLGSSTGLRCVTLPQTSQEKALAALEINKDAIPDNKRYSDLIQHFIEYFSGKQVDFPNKFDLSEATAFQRKVWEATRQIPYGQTRSYSWVARKTGKPSAVRAVGQALGKNPLPIIIPCHRVLRSDRSLGGFGGGLAMKRHLLTLEKINIDY